VPSGQAFEEETGVQFEASPPLPKRKDFRIGVLGSGFIVSDCHLVSYRKVGFNPVAIASRTRENASKAAQRHAIARVYDTYDQLLDDPGIEVLDIAVPPQNQFDLIEKACERKTVKGILAQKPLGLNFAEAKMTVDLCAKAGIALAVNQNMRYDPSVRATKALLDSGKLGSPVFGTIDMRGIPHFKPWQQELGWVTLRIMSIHHLDCLRYWFGDPARIYCSTRTDPRTKFEHADGICTYVLEYDNGLRCVGIDDIWTGPAREGCPADIRINYRIEGTDGLAMGDIGWCKDPYTSPSTLKYATKGDSGFTDAKLTGSWFPDAFAGTMAQLLIALETGKEPAIVGKDNLKTMALVEAAYRSAEKHYAVEVSSILA
jgi:predicted dehydrogenase